MDICITLTHLEGLANHANMVNMFFYEADAKVQDNLLNKGRQQTNIYI